MFCLASLFRLIDLRAIEDSTTIPLSLKLRKKYFWTIRETTRKYFCKIENRVRGESWNFSEEGFGTHRSTRPLSRILPGLSRNLFKLFRFFSSSKSFTQPLHAFPFRLTLFGFDKQLRFSRTLLSRYAVFSDYSSLATRRLLYLFLSCFSSPYACYSLSFSLFRIFLPFGSICISRSLTCLCHQGQATLRGLHRHLS